MSTLHWLGGLVVVAVALRSTWSPCGVSMLSTLTPLRERSRGHRWVATALWFILGSVLGGLVLGLLAAPATGLFGRFAADDAWVMVAVIVVALLALVTDLRVGRYRLPGHERQVDECWIDRYRPWVYAGGFGAQIGSGFATVTMTGGLYLMVVLWIAAGDAFTAILLGGVFGLLRGSAILAGARITDPATLREFHRRFERLAPWPVALVVGAEVLTIVFATVTLGAPLLGVVIAGIPLAAAVTDRRDRPAHNPRSSRRLTPGGLPTR